MHSRRCAHAQSPLRSCTVALVPKDADRNMLRRILWDATQASSPVEPFGGARRLGSGTARGRTRM
eukprot:4248078-Pleurochrysis_carterae.AAC.1